MLLKKFEGNPILSPNIDNQWESLVVCNPGAWYENGKFYLYYRAAGNDEAHHIHIGLAVSDDGFHFKRVSDKPVLSPTKDNFDAGFSRRSENSKNRKGILYDLCFSSLSSRAILEI